MNTRNFTFGRWTVACIPADGGRVSALRYDGTPLLTEPAGEGSDGASPFEMRQIYGYDDCFPSVDECPFPTAGIPAVPDHGELCWLPFDLQETTDRLIFTTNSKLYPVRFSRTMLFTEHKLSWRFHLVGTGQADLPCMHIMHPLMPLKDVVGLSLPEFGSAFDESTNKLMPVKTAAEFTKFLLSVPQGYARTLLLRDLKGGQVDVALRAGLTVRMTFCEKLMPTMAVWWNCGTGAPGRKRWECAFEPAAGTWSSLSKSAADGACWKLRAGQSLDWTVDWEIVSP